MASPAILWWGRSDVHYSRNRIVRQCMRELGYSLIDFSPRISALGDLEAAVRGGERPVLVWVPCFRQRDLAAAARWAHRRQIPLVFDPLISAYDKQVLEKSRFSSESFWARRLLRREGQLFRSADRLVADTLEHARFFSSTFQLPEEHVQVLPVAAEESLFYPRPAVERTAGAPLEVLFFGSFIGLQGPQVIVEAARLYQGPPVRWKLVGEGPLYEECRLLAAGIESVRFEPWVDYERLPETIHGADVVLGIFGTSAKAGRVIPNKVYQGLACGKPLVTRDSPAYPAALHMQSSGIVWVQAGSAEALAAAVSTLAQDPPALAVMGARARSCYEEYFSLRSLRESLGGLLDGLISADRQGRH